MMIGSEGGFAFRVAFLYKKKMKKILDQLNFFSKKYPFQKKYDLSPVVVKKTSFLNIISVVIKTNMITSNVQSETS